MARRGRKVIAKRKARAKYAKKQRRLRRRAARRAFLEDRDQLAYDMPVTIVWPQQTHPMTLYGREVP
jgi:hypothetical protein